MLCPMRCQITAAVPHSLYLVKKLTVNHTAGDLGSQSDCCVECGISTTIIDLGIIMDPVIIIAALIILAVEVYIRLL